MKACGSASSGGGIACRQRSARPLRIRKPQRHRELGCTGGVRAEVPRGGSTAVELLSRTGGEQRLSDFLLWECAFAQLLFLQKRWPDFTAADLDAAVKEFSRRERTRGALPDAIAGYSNLE